MTPRSWVTNTNQNGVTDINPEIYRLLNELLEIGERDGFISAEGGPQFDEMRHRRAREIGERLNRLGGIAFMRAAHDCVRSAGGEARKLEMAWDGIGDWWG